MTGRSKCKITGRGQVLIMAVCVKHEATSTRVGSAGVTDPLGASDGHRVSDHKVKGPVLLIQLLWRCPQAVLRGLAIGNLDLMEPSL